MASDKYIFTVTSEGNHIDLIIGSYSRLHVVYRKLATNLYELRNFGFTDPIIYELENASISLDKNFSVTKDGKCHYLELIEIEKMLSAICWTLGIHDTIMHKIQGGHILISADRKMCDSMADFLTSRPKLLWTMGLTNDLSIKYDHLGYSVVISGGGNLANIALNDVDRTTMIEKLRNVSKSTLIKIAPTAHEKFISKVKRATDEYMEEVKKE